MATVRWAPRTNEMTFQPVHQRQHSSAGYLLPLLLLLLSLIPTALAQPADPNDPSTWNITTSSITNLTATTQSFNLTLNLPTLDLLYLVLPSSPASSSLFVLDPSNPAWVDTVVSLAPVDSDDYLALWESVMNVSDPMYGNDTVIAAGVVAATGAWSISLSLSLPPSAIFTIYYLLVSNTTGTPLYSQPLTQLATTNLTVPAACLTPPPLAYCTTLASTTLYPSYLSPFALDEAALDQYTADLSLYSPAADCTAQRTSANASMCGDCLVVRQRWQCALAFSGCSSDSGGGVVVGGGDGGPCRWLCVEKNSRCNEVEDCSVYATSDCNSAWSVVSGGGGVGARMWLWLLSGLVALLMTWVS